jgi:hypothetical protein
MKTLTMFFILIFLTSFKADNLPKDFDDLLIRANMTFDSPQDFGETEIIHNKQMNYDYAIKNKDKSLEIRYAVRPLDNLLKDYTIKEQNKQPGDVYISPNKFYPAALQATIMNISGGKMPRINVFPKEAIKTEFNADWGATTITEVGKEFGQNYKYCMIVAIHKDNIADAYYFYLFDKQETIQSALIPVFHALKFK